MHSAFDTGPTKILMMRSRCSLQTIMFAVAGMLMVLMLPSVSAGDDSFTFGDMSDVSCNQTSNATSGAISLPATLPKGACVITVKRNSTNSSFTTLYVTSVALSGNDSLVIYDGNYTNPNNTVRTVSDSSGPFTAVVSSELAYLVVKVTADNSSSKLVGTFNTDGCSINQTVDRSMYTATPVYLPGRGAFTCDYTYTLPDSSAGTQLALSFQTVGLPNATLNFTSPSKTPPVTGTTRPADVYSAESLQMTLAVTNVSTPQSFQATVTPVILNDVCGKVQNISGTGSVKITVPKFHPLSFDCRVPLTAAKGKSLFLNVTSLSLTKGGDQLTILDGSSVGGNVLASLTTNTTGYIALTSGKEALLRFVVDELIGERSVDIAVTELMSVNHLRTKGNWTLPESNNSQYYLLEADAGSMVEFTLGAAENTTDVYTVSLYDGTQPTSPLLLTFSSGVRVPVNSTGSSMLVVAQLTSTYKPLSASFQSTNTSCDQVKSDTYGSFRLMLSPREPTPKACRWTIVTSQPNSAGNILVQLPSLQLKANATVSVYSGVQGSGSLLARLTAANNTVPGRIIPTIAIPASQWAQLVFSSGTGENQTAEVQATYRVDDRPCGGELTNKTHGHLMSPTFPNLYFLNSACEWTFPPSKPGRLLFFDFPTMQLAGNHSLTIVDKGKNSSKVMGAYQGKGPVPSLLYASNDTNVVGFSAPSDGKLSAGVDRGFDVEYWVLNCGGNITAENGSFSTPGYPKTMNSSLCVWIINLPRNSSKGVNIAQLKVAGTLTNDTVKVFDGDSMRMPRLYLNTSRQNGTLSRYNTVIILVDASSVPAGKGIALQFNYTTYTCNKSEQCDNGLCMHPEWKCNGKDDCGDNSDERNCVITPPPPKPAASTSGVKPAVAGVLFVVGLLIGVIAVVVIPRIIRRFRAQRYSRFDSEPPLA